MKKSTWLSLSFLITAFSAIAQNEVMLHLAPRLGAAAFSLDAPFDHPGGTYQVKYTRFEYYISEVKITHDGGQITPCTDLHLLVRPAQDSMYSLGQLPAVNNVEAITFSVGVEQAFNHLDPASFPPGDPLAPQNPAMQWGWSAGYRFAAVEGEAGTNLGQHFEIHALGDANYKTQTISTNAEQVAPDMKMIHLVADYSQVVKNITLSNGLTVHGTTGAAVTLLNNFKNVVFTAQTSTGLLDPSFIGQFEVSPNPVMAGAPTQARFSLPAGNQYTLTMTDLTGKTILRQVLAAGENQSVLLENNTGAGMFFVHLWQNEQPVAVAKLVILN